MKHERLEVDREDLLAEATALVDRVELAVEGFAEPIVIGFRKHGDASIYFGADPVYQFTVSGALRRAYVSGQLIKAVRGQLATMSRHRTETAVELRSQVLSVEQQTAALSQLIAAVEMMRRACSEGKFAVLRQVSSGLGKPEGEPQGNANANQAISRALQWLAALTLPPLIASAPNAGR